MVSRDRVMKLSGKEIIQVRGFAIAYQATWEALGGGYSVGTVGGPVMIQAEQIPEELHEPILALVRQHMRERWRQDTVSLTCSECHIQFELRRWQFEIDVEEEGEDWRPVCLSCLGEEDHDGV